MLQHSIVGATYRSRLLVFLLLATPLAAIAADEPPQPNGRGRFGVGVQRVTWTSLGVGASVDLSPNLTLEGLRSVFGDTSYACRMRVRLTSGFDRRLYAYGMAGSTQETETRMTSSTTPGGTISLPSFESETHIGAGLGVGIEQDLRGILGAPLFANAELGAEHFGDIGTRAFIGFGLQFRFGAPQRSPSAAGR